MMITSLVMGAKYYKRVQLKGIAPLSRINQFNFNKKFFRPSCYGSLNNRFKQHTFFKPYFNKHFTEIVLPQSLMQTPIDTIINFYSILREAANFSGDTIGGCGTVGQASIPYPIAYNFFTKYYQFKIDYESFHHSFQNIGHINLINVRLTTSSPLNQDQLRYFIELETIEGSDKGITYFAYYYGFMFLKKENGLYKIEDFKLEGEDFLCAPYHGWSYDAEMIIQTEYGNWCNLVSKQYPTFQQGDTKQIYFDGTDGYGYLIVFVEVTNGYDIEIAQYRIDESGKWQPIMFNPLDCIEN
ncbi:MAG: hypothetical protein ACQEWF_22865 [Bacillota bacterium]